MKLENIATSLKMSKELEGAGFVADTCFWWFKHKYGYRVGVESQILVASQDVSAPRHKAYSFQQLWEVLTDIYIEGHQFTLNWKNIVALWSSRRLSTVEDFGGEDLHLPDSAAKTVLWCIKEGHLEV